MTEIEASVVEGERVHYKTRKYSLTILHRKKAKGLKL
jgi:hypothetical protein